MKIHRLVHGYDNGHRKLVGSIKLSEEDEELINRLSDLSGPLLGETGFTPYFTGYPLPSRKYFALAKTWLDRNAARMGSVLTTTLLIPLLDYIECNDLNVFFSLLNQEAQREELSKYKEPITFDTKSTIDYSDQSFYLDWLIDDHLLTFVDYYFGQGVKPVIWPSEKNAPEVVASIHNVLWPSLREEFSYCTLSLQLRYVSESQPFHILFAPEDRIDKYHQRYRKYYVGRKLQKGVFLDESASIGWQKLIALEIARGNKETSIKTDYLGLWENLPPDPTVFAKLFSLSDLWQRASVSPNALVGILDLIISISPNSDDAIKFKTRVIDRALESFKKHLDQQQVVRALYLFSERLRKTSYRQINKMIFTDLIDLVSLAARNFPEIALDLVKNNIVDNSKTIDPFLYGVAEGLYGLLKESSNLSALMQPSITAYPALIIAKPALAIEFYKISLENSYYRIVSNEFAESIKYIHDQSTLQVLRKELIGLAISQKDLAMFRSLVSDVEEEEYELILNEIVLTHTLIYNSELFDILEKEMIEKRPLKIRQWALKRQEWPTEISYIVAASFDKNLKGFQSISQQPYSDFRLGSVYLAYLATLNKGTFPEWLVFELLKQTDIVSKMFLESLILIPEYINIIAQLIIDVPELPFHITNTLFKLIEIKSQSNERNNLVNSILGKTIFDYKIGLINKSDYISWMRYSPSIEWFRNIRPQRFIQLIDVSNVTNNEQYIRLWEIIANAPDSLYTREWRILDTIIASLLEVRNLKFLESIISEWEIILLRAEKLQNYSLHQILSDQALEFAFTHNAQQVSKIIRYSFPVVYRAYVGEKPYSTISYLFTYFSDWDKGRELRARIVNAFIGSNWPPEDLALSMPDNDTFRKIFKRLSKNEAGSILIKKMFLELRKSKSIEAKEKAELLEKLMKSPEFYEPWV